MTPATSMMATEMRGSDNEDDIPLWMEGADGNSPAGNSPAIGTELDTGQKDKLHQATMFMVYGGRKKKF